MANDIDDKGSNRKSSNSSAEVAQQSDVVRTSLAVSNAQSILAKVGFKSQFKKPNPKHAERHVYWNAFADIAPALVGGADDYANDPMKKVMGEIAYVILESNGVRQTSKPSVSAQVSQQALRSQPETAFDELIHLPTSVDAHAYDHLYEALIKTVPLDRIVEALDSFEKGKFTFNKKDETSIKILLSRDIVENNETVNSITKFREGFLAYQLNNMESVVEWQRNVFVDVDQKNFLLALSNSSVIQELRQAHWGKILDKMPKEIKQLLKALEDLEKAANGKMSWNNAYKNVSEALEKIKPDHLSALREVLEKEEKIISNSISNQKAAHKLYEEGRVGKIKNLEKANEILSGMQADKAKIPNLDSLVGRLNQLLFPKSPVILFEERKAEKLPKESKTPSHEEQYQSGKKLHALLIIIEKNKWDVGLGGVNVKDMSGHSIKLPKHIADIHATLKDAFTAEKPNWVSVLESVKDQIPRKTELPPVGKRTTSTELFYELAAKKLGVDRTIPKQKVVVVPTGTPSLFQRYKAALATAGIGGSVLSGLFTAALVLNVIPILGQALSGTLLIGLTIAAGAIAGGLLTTGLTAAGLNYNDKKHPPKAVAQVSPDLQKTLKLAEEHKKVAASSPRRSPRQGSPAHSNNKISDGLRNGSSSPAINIDPQAAGAIDTGPQSVEHVANILEDRAGTNTYDPDAIINEMPASNTSNEDKEDKVLASDDERPSSRGP